MKMVSQMIIRWNKQNRTVEMKNRGYILCTKEIFHHIVLYQFGFEIGVILNKCCIGSYYFVVDIKSSI